MSQWINRQALLLDFEPQFIFRSPLYSFRFPAALGITGCQETEMWRVGTQGARGPPLQPGTVCGRKGDGRSQGVGSRRQRAPPRSVVLGRKSLRGRATHGSSTSSANGFHAARDSRELRSARPTGEAEFPAGRTPLPLHAAENPRPQVPPGREVLHRLLALTSANSSASPQPGREDRPYF